MCGRCAVKPAIDRFRGKIRQTETGCWEWTAARNPAGYGRFHGGLDNHDMLAHRWAYEHFVGPIPDGLHLDHLCRNRACCNPRHLEPVTCRENLLRGETVTAQHAEATHCPAGHPYDEVNTYSWNGWRRCRKCNSASVQRAKARRREKAA